MQTEQTYVSFVLCANDIDEHNQNIVFLVRYIWTLLGNFVILKKAFFKFIPGNKLFNFVIAIIFSFLFLIS